MALDAMRILVAVVDTGSIKAAARDLSLSRNTVRRKLDELEARVGTRLVVRDENGVTPSPTGAALVARARGLLEEATELLDQVDALAAEPSGVVRLAGPVGPPIEAIAMLREMMKASFPRLQIAMHHCHRPLDALRDGADLAITMERELPMPGALIEVIELGSVRERLLASDDYLARHPAITGVDDLGRHEIFVWRAPDSVDNSLPTLEGKHVAIVPALSSNSIALVRQSAVRGLGLAYAPNAEFGFFPDLDGLRPVLPEVFGVSRPVRLIAPRSALALPWVRAVFDFQRNFMASVLAPPQGA